ncbi:hypothetical protein P7M45_23485, partial [Vibrio parahaemolyticus]|nr:hypothetical protein [Vibrio parahaemolyticus]
PVKRAHFSDRPAYSCLTQVLSISDIVQKTSSCKETQRNTQYLLRCESMTAIGNVANVRTD